MPRKNDDPAPWAKYLDPKTRPKPRLPEGRENEFRVRSVINGEVFEYIVVRDWRRGAEFQDQGVPAVGNDEIAVLKRATSGAKLDSTMSAAILRVKSHLGGAIVAARTLGQNAPSAKGVRDPGRRERVWRPKPR